MTKTKRLLLFDIDSTLVATLGAGVKALQQIIERRYGVQDDLSDTGTVVAATGSMVAVQKGTEQFEFDIDPATTKGSAEIKVGSTVTVTYVMSATKVEAAGGPGAKTETPEASASPGSSE